MIFEITPMNKKRPKYVVNGIPPQYAQSRIGTEMRKMDVGQSTTKFRSAGIKMVKCIG